MGNGIVAHSVSTKERIHRVCELASDVRNGFLVLAYDPCRDAPSLVVKYTVPSAKNKSDRPSVEAKLLLSWRDRTDRPVSIVRACDAWTTSHGLVALVLPYFPLGDILTTVLHRGAWDEKRARHAWHQLVDGLEWIHTQQLVHGDVALENMVVADHQGSVRLIDFGRVAAFGCTTHRRTCPPSDWHRCTIVQQDSSTLAFNRRGYISPERYHASHGRCDPRREEWFAAGVALFTMLVGNPPLQDDNTDPRKQDAYAHFIGCGKLAAVLKQWNVSLSPEAIDLLERLLVDDPKTRLCHSREVRAHAWWRSET
jgi:protein-serine/threonine kinase